MKILKIIHGYPPLYNAGSEVYSQSICDELCKSHDVLVFTREENPFRPDFSIRNQRIHESLAITLVNMPRSKDGFRHQELDARFAGIVTEFNPDVAHIGHLNHLSTGIVDVLKETSIPIVFTLHDFWLMCPRGQFLQRNFGEGKLHELCDGQEHEKCSNTCYKMLHSGYEVPWHRSMSYEMNHIIPTGKDALSDGGYWTDWVEARMDETSQIVNKVDQFIAPSKYLMQRFIKDFNVPEEKIIYLDYGFPTHYLTPSSNKTHSKKYRFGYIGTHIPAKGINLLIEAFKNLNVESELFIWGAKDQQATNALKVLAEGNNDIHFMGEYVNQNLADEVFGRVDCIVVPSIWTENSPLVIHEAQACHIPVITANVGGMAEYVDHRTNGLLFRHRDVSSLLEQMQWAAIHPDKMIGLGKRGYLYSDDGSIPNVKDHCLELEKIYSGLIAKQRSSFWRLTLDTNPEDCNLSCTMCEEHSEFSSFMQELYEKTGVKRRRMPFEMVESIMKSAKGLGIREIIPSTMGEPLLYKRMEDLFALAEGLGLKINLTTNGTFPKKTVEEWAQIIVPITTDVKISWNGATKETAEAIMKKLKFEEAVENIKRFVAVRDDHYNKTGYYCRVTFQLTFMRNNMHELPDIIRLAAELGVDRVKGHHLWAHFEEIKKLSFKTDPMSIARWNSIVEQAVSASDKYMLPNGKKVLLENIEPLREDELTAVPEEYECPFLGKELWVSATGKVSPCCAPDNLRQSLGDFGNLNDTTLEQVVSSDQYLGLCVDYKSRLLCQTCNMRKPV